MKNKYKIILVKTIIGIGGILLISSAILGITSEMNLYGVYNAFINKLSYFLFLLVVIDCIIMLILMDKIDIRPEKTKPMKLKLKDNNYEVIKKNICQKYEQSNYKEFNEYEYGIANIAYMIKQNYSETSLIIFIRTKELTEEILYGFEENIFTKQILNSENIESRDKLDIIYVIIVDKVTPVFSKYTEKNIKQTFWLTILPIGISLASKTIYIVAQKEGFSILRYKKMKKQFINDIDDMLEK